MSCDGTAQRRLIIDTDPGIDDSMAILAAFNSSEVEVLALTTCFGNVPTHLATRNARHLTRVAGREDVRVVPGSDVSIMGEPKVRIADFVHGSDGFGNTTAEGDVCCAPHEESTTAADYIVQKCREAPGSVTIIALGVLTNVALALKKAPDLPNLWHELVILGGAFHTNGNVNPAAEANVFGDPEAADHVFSHATRSVRVVGLDVTHKCVLTSEDLEGLSGQGRFGDFLSSITRFYVQYHRDSYGLDGSYTHDPTALMAAIDPSLFTWTEGPVCVVLDGPARGATLMDSGLKSWNAPNGWSQRPALRVATGVRSEDLLRSVKTRMSM